MGCDVQIIDHYREKAADQPIFESVEIEQMFIGNSIWAGEEATTLINTRARNGAAFGSYAVVRGVTRLRNRGDVPARAQN